MYVVTDAKGNRVYTDRPQTLPAQKAGIQSTPTDPAEVQARAWDLATDPAVGGWRASKPEGLFPRPQPPGAG